MFGIPVEVLCRIAHAFYGNVILCGLIFMAIGLAGDHYWG